MTDDAIIASQLRAGDVTAFEQLFRALHAPLCEVADSYVHSQDVAEEIVQDLFFALWQRREAFELRGSLRGYLFSAVRNRALHHVRHVAVTRRAAEHAAAEVVDATMGEPVSRPDRHLEQQEVRQALARAVTALPDRSRLAFVLKWQHRMRNAEIAEAMGISEKGVEKLNTIAIRHLRSSLGPYAEAIDVTLS